jgi:hypothetical protein
VTAATTTTLDSTDAPRVSGPIPWVGAGLALLRDPTAFFQRTREQVGDTFLVEGFGYRVFCVFSPEGVKGLWALPEAEASKGVADFGMLAHKVPAELFAGRRTFPHMLFAREDVEVYLDNLVVGRRPRARVARGERASSRPSPTAVASPIAWASPPGGAAPRRPRIGSSA